MSSATPAPQPEESKILQSFPPRTPDFVVNKTLNSSAHDPNKEGGVEPGKDPTRASEQNAQPGLINYRLVWNDGTSPALIDLTHLKNIFSFQLPKMPKEYIFRLVFDRNHRSLCICKGRRVIGGICFRPFHTQRFAEIVFCAITSTEQVKGFGTKLMNNLKEHAKSEGIEYFLTYADNYAIGYFRKQGFTKEVTMPKLRWGGFIKEYDGGTLMECKINQSVDYLNVRGMLKRQREEVYQKIRQVSASHRRYPGLPSFTKKRCVLDIPGIREAGFDLGFLESAQEQEQDGQGLAKALSPEEIARYARFNAVLKTMRASKHTAHFQVPVDAKEVRSYYDVIKNPMDLETLSNRLDTGNVYKSIDDFASDFFLIFDNCRTFNPQNTSYYACADKSEALFLQTMHVHFPSWSPPSTRMKNLSSRQEGSAVMSATASAVSTAVGNVAKRALSANSSTPASSSDK